HRALEAEEHPRHLLALALERGALGEDLLGEMARRVGARNVARGRRRLRGQRGPAGRAEASTDARDLAARRTRWRQDGAARFTEARRRFGGMAAARTEDDGHGPPPACVVSGGRTSG